MAVRPFVLALALLGCRETVRLQFEPERRHDHIGFRIVAVRV